MARRLYAAACNLSGQEEGAAACVRFAASWTRPLVWLPWFAVTPPAVEHSGIATVTYSDGVAV